MKKNLNTERTVENVVALCALGMLLSTSAIYVGALVHNHKLSRAGTYGMAITPVVSPMIALVSQKRQRG